MQKLRLSFALLFAFVFNLSINAQVNHSQNDQYKKDSIFFKKIYEEALLRGHSYARLGELCKDVGARLSGSDAAEKGVLWAIKMLNAYRFDSVYTQPVMVPRWERETKKKYNSNLL